MIGGTLYGTGRKFEHLTAHQRVTAMKVSKIDNRDQPGFLQTRDLPNNMIIVLVALRSCLLLCFHRMQNLYLRFPYANYRQTNSHLDPLYSYGPHSPRWTRLLLPYATAMQAALILLDQNRLGSID